MKQSISYKYTAWMVIFLLLAGCNAAVPVTGQSGATSLPQATVGSEQLSATATTPIDLAPTAEGNLPTETVPQVSTEAADSSSKIACTAPAVLTPALTEGPYYTANPPENSNFVQEGTPGTRLYLSGYVLDTNCQPIPNTRVDFWQADANGQYDNSGYNFRGYQLTDANGLYQLETVVPGEYPGRTEHIHVKISAPNGPVITSQLFFPGVTQNNSDNIFDQALLVTWEPVEDGYQAQYNFVINP